MNAISSSICRLTEYEDLLWNESTQQTEEVKASFTTACYNIIEFQARAACYLHDKRFKSAIRDAFKLDGWNDLLTAIKEAEARVKDCAERMGLNGICKIFNRVDKLKDEIVDGIGEHFSDMKMKQETIDRNQKVNSFLELLYDNACSYEDSKNRNRERVPGTCNWFTSHSLFKRWISPAESQGQIGRAHV